MSFFHIAVALTLSWPCTPRLQTFDLVHDDAHTSAIDSQTRGPLSAFMQTPGTQLTADVTTSVDAPKKTAPTEEECLALAQKILDAAVAGDGAAIEAMLDYDALLLRATEGVAAPNSFRTGYMFGVKKSIVGEVGPVARMFVRSASSETGGVHFLRLRHVDQNVDPDVDQDPTLLFRVRNAKGLDYYELRVGRNKSGEIVVTDTLTFLSGEWLSSALRRKYVLSAAAQLKSLREKLSDEDKALVDHAKEFRELGKAVQAGEWSKALEIHAALPESMQKEKYVLLLRLMAAQNTDAETYLAGLEDLHRGFARDPCFALHAIDYYLLKGETENATAAFAVLDAAVGGDAYLDYLHGALFVATKDFDAALVRIAQGLEREPELIELWWLRVSCHIGLEEYEAVYDTLVAMDDSFEMEWSDLAAQPLYAGFLASPWYAKWLEHLAEDKDG